MEGAMEGGRTDCPSVRWHYHNIYNVHGTILAADLRLRCVSSLMAVLAVPQCLLAWFGPGCHISACILKKNNKTSQHKSEIQWTIEWFIYMYIYEQISFAMRY